ncbi:MAG: GGDEF domain-containing protein [Lachnospiraceae bacterium]|nr:GGDEF domain-containing protein [Lachnospiraceae bacterium]
MIDGFTGISKKYFRIFILSVIIFSILLCINFYALFSSMKQNIIASGEHDVIKSATETNYFLLENIDAIKLASYSIEKMMDDGESSEAIEAYLNEQTDVFKNALNDDFAGAYGVFDGVYLDGIGWEPEDGYVPEERKWFTDAIEADGEVALVSPYLDKLTGTMMMSISKMLKDGRSVVSIDVSLDTIQNITEERVPDGKGNYALVLDKDGTVVAHSAASKRGESYLKGNGTFGNIVAEKLFATEDNHFEVQYNGVRYMVFSGKIGTEWYALTVMNENSLYGPLKIIYFIFFFVMIFFLGALTALFLRLNKRRAETDNLNTQLKSISAIYAVAYLLDLNTDTFEEIISNDRIRALLINGQTHAMDTLKLVMDMNIAEISKRNIASFLDFSTLDERLSTSVTVAQEFLNSDNRWCRGRFIVVDKNSDDTLRRVMWMVEVIDEEKRQRDNLQMLSETDRMTGILNRGGGEAKIREMLDSGRSGMFCLMDADKFKSINDNFGHGVGDKVLIAIADCLKKSFRDNDIVMRLGGDEFAAYAPTVLNEKVGQQIIDRFFDNIDKIEIPELGDRKICISMGVAFYHPNDEYSFDELYKHADHGTYNSKKHEGNYVSYYTGEEY